MTAIVHSFVRVTSQQSDLAVVAVISLAGLVITLAALRLGFDLGPGIAG